MTKDFHCFQKVVGALKTGLGWAIVISIVNLIVYVYLFEF